MWGGTGELVSSTMGRIDPDVRDRRRGSRWRSSRVAPTITSTELRMRAGHTANMALSWGRKVCRRWQWARWGGGPWPRPTK